ncbi:hypothetical protein [Flavihumibacter fluvii]|uniref:hypothetical protein n=1 Tax=Flavihumibacter fluvii TaxID=2838157 RepID=UPI001BDE67BE|nr:hypothetical protein [Flavihumibacter fluvii]ULQ50880.1 hypothetical protein KJS93_12375 [Flavihumibacter fluvii]
MENEEIKRTETKTETKPLENKTANKKIKKRSSVAAINRAMGSAVSHVKAIAGGGLANEGTSVSYDEARLP